MPDIDVTFAALQQDYIAKLNLLVTEANTAFGLRLTQAQVDARVAAIGVLLSGLSSDLNAAGFRVIGSGNAINPGDLCNLPTVQALITGGGTPANIPIWSLGEAPAAKFSLERAVRRSRQLTYA